MAHDTGCGSKAAAEFLGTMFLVATVVGSGIMGERLAGGNVALALLANTLATGAVLVALILALGPVSGAHLNPAVTALLWLRGEHPRRRVFPYVLAQLAGGVVGAMLANLMFEVEPAVFSTRVRSGWPLLLSEVVATTGLLLVIVLCARNRPRATAAAVGCYVSAGYWFTSSTAFANPAVTVSRALTDTFTGIRPGDVPGFLFAQGIGVLAAAAVLRMLDAAPAREAAVPKGATHGPAID